MKVLYAIQGTGNGHLSRAIDILPELKSRAEVDVLISGTQGDIDIPHEVKYRLQGVSFIFGQKGGIDYRSTWKSNSFGRFLKEVYKLPVKEYDVVVNDFEPVSAWSAFVKGVPCYSMSHQAALLSKKVPRPVVSDPIGSIILKAYAPTSERIGFHFKEYDDFIHTPSIRPEIRDVTVSDRNFYLVYLPSYSNDRIQKILSQIPDVNWCVFSKTDHRIYRKGRVFFRPVDREDFTKMLGQCTGVICGAGFETPAEALYLGKKLLVIPMKGQYEQHLNALALKEMGVPVVRSLSQKYVGNLLDFIESEETIKVDYPEVKQDVVDELLLHYMNNNLSGKLSSSA